MIRSDVQSVRTENRLRQIQDEIRELETQYSGLELEFWAGQLREEAAKLQSESSEYKLLRKLPLEDAIDYILANPVLIENVGELLTKLRIAAKLTQEEMANMLGWQQSNLSRFENENYSSQTIGKISEYIGALGVYLHITPSMTEQSSNIVYKTEWAQQQVERTAVDIYRTIFVPSPTSGSSGNIISSQPPTPDTGLAGSLFTLQRLAEHEPVSG